MWDAWQTSVGGQNFDIHFWENSAVTTCLKSCFTNVPFSAMCGVDNSGCGTVAVWWGSHSLPGPQAHTLVFLKPWPLGPLVELLFELFWSLQLSAVFKALFVLNSSIPVSVPFPASYLFQNLDITHYTLPTFAPISSFVSDLWSHHKSHLSLPFFRIYSPVASTSNCTRTKERGWVSCYAVTQAAQ